MLESTSHLRAAMHVLHMPARGPPRRALNACRRHNDTLAASFGQPAFSRRHSTVCICNVASQENEAAPPSNSTKKAGCYGCGERLQTQHPSLPGYVQEANYETKRRHRQLNALLCARCQALSNGAMIPGVADFAQQQALRQASATAQADVTDAPEDSNPAAASPASTASDEMTHGRHKKRASVQLEPTTLKALATPEELRARLQALTSRRSLVVLLIDMLDASGTILGRVRNLVGNNPIIAVGTKLDLLPAGVDQIEVAAWLQAALAFKRVSTAAVYCVSSRTGQGVADAVATIRKERRGRDVYVLGAANVGKSAFIRALVNDMASMRSRQFDPASIAPSRRLPVESAMPGTTLGLIPLEVFSSGGVLYDTPGLHLHHRIPHMLTPMENKEMHPRRRLRPYVAPSLTELNDGSSSDCDVSTAGDIAVSNQSGDVDGDDHASVLAAYWWGGLVRIDVLHSPVDVRLVFYGPPALHVVANGAEIDEMRDKSSLSENEAETIGCGGAEPPLAFAFGAASAMARGGLKASKRLSIPLHGALSGECVADVAISGIPGWIGVYVLHDGMAIDVAAERRRSGRIVSGDGEVGVRGRKQDAENNALHLRVWAPVGIGTYIRPPLPVPSPLL